MPSLTITVIQTNIFWEDKSANLAMLEEKIRGISDNTEIVILPEMFSTGFSMNAAALAETMEGPTVLWMKKMASSRNVIVCGSVIIEDNGNYFNRLIWMLPNGQFGLYDKRHRFAYAGEDQKYSNGSRRLIASVKGWKINLLVCYDLRFPVWSRQHLTRNDAGELIPEYDVLIYVANWPERRNMAWKTLLQARAIENQCYVVGVNRIGDDANDIYYNGDSTILDPLGNVIWQQARDSAEFTYTLDQQKLLDVRRQFPFWKDGDLFSIES